MRQSFLPRAFLSCGMRNPENLGAVPLTHAVTSRTPYILVRSRERCCTVWAWPIVPTLLREVWLQDLQTGARTPFLHGAPEDGAA
jgi:hypothetical protein